MTGNDILKDAAALMAFETPSEEMQNIGLTIINFVLEDLDKESVKTLEDSIELTEAEASAEKVGVAMLLSVALGDLRAKECFSEIYHEKRRKVKNGKTSITDSLPKGELL